MPSSRSITNICLLCSLPNSNCTKRICRYRAYRYASKLAFSSFFPSIWIRWSKTNRTFDSSFSSTSSLSSILTTLTSCYSFPPLFSFYSLWSTRYPFLISRLASTNIFLISHTDSTNHPGSTKHSTMNLSRGYLAVRMSQEATIQLLRHGYCAVRLVGS